MIHNSNVSRIIDRWLEESKHIGAMKTGTGREAAISRMALHPDQTKIRKVATINYGTQYRKMIKRLSRAVDRGILEYVTRSANGEPTAKLKKELQDVFRDAYLEAYRSGVLSTGIKKVAPGKGESELTDSERQWAVAAWNEEMRYFRKLLSDIDNGVVRGDPRKRAVAYVTTVGAIYDAGRIRSIPENNLIHWVLHPAEHCESCLALAKGSPYTSMTLPTTPRAGATRCMHNCKCTIKIVKATVEKVEQRANANKQYLSRLARTKIIRAPALK